jgi:hypothetical protein
MEWLVYIGAIVSTVGLVGIIWTIFNVISARRAKLDDADLRARMSRILPVNIGALFLSVIGLMMVVVGVVLS